jgi:stearoyl-CoA desaturase (delta-9 desaturase)
MFNPILKNLKEVPNLLLILTPTLLLGMWACYDIVANYEHIKLIYFLLGYFVINIIGVTAGLHRYFSHRSFKASKWKERFMLWAAVIAGQGSPVWWVALHRGYHHRCSDTKLDHHSPIHGFWHSFILWMYRIRPEAVNFKYAIDCLRNPDVVWFSTHYNKVWVVSNLIFLIISWEFFLYFSIMAAFVTLVTYNITNSLNHTPGFGYTNFDTKDNSMNVWWLWPFVFGETWHNNHHAKPGRSYLGIKWWELDPAGTFIKMFQDRKK